jgi:serine protease Do
MNYEMGHRFFAKHTKDSSRSQRSRYFFRSNSLLGQFAILAFGLSSIWIPIFSVMAQSSRVEENDLTSSRENAITRSVREISPAVVGINVTAVQERQSPFGSNDPFFRQFFQDNPFFNQLFGPQKFEVQSLGSGFIISPDGYVVTNEHVVKDATKIIVTMTDGSKRSANIVGHDDQSDLALLKIDGNSLPYCEFGNSDSILVGEWVIAFGNPFGLFDVNNKPTVTVGVVSSLGMNLSREGSRNYSDMIETDAAINPGNSGGPLVDADGKVIGINTMIYTAGVSQAYIGYGFAIPINKVARVVNELKKFGRVRHESWTGLDLQTVDRNIAKYFGMSEPSGALVNNVEEGSPADKSGFKQGDLILKYQGKPVHDAVALQSLLDDLKPGSKVKFEVLRENNLVTLSLRVGTKENK